MIFVGFVIIGNKLNLNGHLKLVTNIKNNKMIFYFFILNMNNIKAFILEIKINKVHIFWT